MSSKKVLLGFLGAFIYAAQAQITNSDVNKEEICENSDRTALLQNRVSMSMKHEEEGKDSAGDKQQASSQVDFRNSEAGLHLETASNAATLSIRPGLADDKVDKITFGVLVKNWHGINFAARHATIDGIVTLQWSDPRVVKLVPKGKHSFRLSGKEAKSQIWMPDVVITNLVEDRDPISSSVLVTSTGQLTSVERVSMCLQQDFVTHEFPFDSQNVTIRLTSAKHMRDELQMVPTNDTSLWGVRTEGVFDESAWSLLNSSITTKADDIGFLRKSRGVVTLNLKRNPQQFLNTIFIPSVVLMSMTWSAFWLPMDGPYIMPRTALNAIAVLCQFSICNTATKIMPATGKPSWMTEYLGLCVQLQFVVMILNTLLQALHCTKAGATFVETVNKHIIVTFPLSTGLNIAILCAGYFTAGDVFVAVSSVCYFIYIGWHYVTAKAE